MTERSDRQKIKMLSSRSTAGIKLEGKIKEAEDRRQVLLMKLSEHDNHLDSLRSEMDRSTGRASSRASSRIGSSRMGSSRSQGAMTSYRPGTPSSALSGVMGNMMASLPPDGVASVPEDGELGELPPAPKVRALADLPSRVRARSRVPAGDRSSVSRGVST